jgi:hypothetical protein
VSLIFRAPLQHNNANKLHHCLLVRKGQEDSAEWMRFHDSKVEAFRSIAAGRERSSAAAAAQGLLAGGLHSYVSRTTTWLAVLNS